MQIYYQQNGFKFIIWSSKSLFIGPSYSEEEIQQEQMGKSSSTSPKTIQGIQTAHCGRFVNHSACFMHAYCKDLDGPQAVWASREYYGHQVLPNNIMETLVAAGKVSRGIMIVCHGV